MNDLLAVRTCFILFFGSIGYFFQPFGLPGHFAFMAGLLVAALVILIEIRIKQMALKRLVGASIGVFSGLLAALLVAAVMGLAGLRDTGTLRFLQVTVLALLGYVGLIVGWSKGDLLNLSALGGLIGGEKSTRHSFTILDTSVIIDGRIADIAETGFLDGTVVIPQFVLHELQLVADSPDSNKRNRGRRGLDILQRIQKMPRLHIQIMEQDFPHIKDVDMKLVELGKMYDCKVVTNDFNLNKVAQLHGVEILNINELANALKPIVLPGETMRVFILKEGKEYNQGVAYLDDGTMVVVDNARKLISKTVDISVTSVLQTTAGKMIFGRFDDRAHTTYEKAERTERVQREPSGATAAPQA